MGQGSPYALNQHSIFATASPIARIPQSRVQGVKMKWYSIIKPSNSLRKIFFHFSQNTVCSSGLEVLVSEERMILPRKHNKHSTELQVKTSSSTFCSLNAFESTAINMSNNDCVLKIIYISSEKSLHIVRG